MTIFFFYTIIAKITSQNYTKTTKKYFNRNQSWLISRNSTNVNIMLHRINSEARITNNHRQQDKDLNIKLFNNKSLNIIKNKSFLTKSMPIHLPEPA